MLNLQLPLFQQEESSRGGFCRGDMDEYSPLQTIHTQHGHIVRLAQNGGDTLHAHARAQLHVAGVTFQHLDTGG